LSNPSSDFTLEAICRFSNGNGDLSFCKKKDCLSWLLLTEVFISALLFFLGKKLPLRYEPFTILLREDLLGFAFFSGDLLRDTGPG
jgi:hypothetical protein